MHSLDVDCPRARCRPYVAGLRSALPSEKNPLHPPALGGSAEPHRRNQQHRVERQVTASYKTTILGFEKVKHDGQVISHIRRGSCAGPCSCNASMITYRFKQPTMARPPTTSTASTSAMAQTQSGVGPRTESPDLEMSRLRLSRGHGM